MAILRICRGVPGSGKSTFAKKTWPSLLLLDNDMFLIQDGQYKWSKDRVIDAIDWCMETTRNALEHNFDVVVANTFTKARYVMAYKKIAEEYGAKFEVYRCTGDFKNMHGLSDSMVQNFKNAMEDWPGEVIVDPT